MTPRQRDDTKGERHDTKSEGHENEEEEECLDPECPDSNSYCVWPDVQRVPVTCQGLESRALFLKQVECAGVRSWLDVDPELDGENIWKLLYIHIRLYFFCTDNGGDQQGQDLELKIDFAGLILQWYWRQWCLHHQLHLIVKKAIDGACGGTYFSDLAKIVNSVRSGSNIKKLRNVATTKLAKVLKKLPPRPLKGRWGSVALTE